MLHNDCLALFLHEQSTAWHGMAWHSMVSCCVINFGRREGRVNTRRDVMMGGDDV